jgi:hypothetical protein
VGCSDLTILQLARQVGAIASSSCSVMVARTGDLFGTKDISAATCSPPPSDLIARSMSSFSGRRAKKFFSRTPTHPTIYGGVHDVGLHLHASGRSTSTKVEIGGRPHSPPASTRSTCSLLACDQDQYILIYREAISFLVFFLFFFFQSDLGCYSFWIG